MLSHVVGFLSIIEGVTGPASVGGSIGRGSQTLSLTSMSTVAEPQAKTANPTAGYVAVKIDMLRRMRNATVDLFVQYDQHAAPVLYHRAGSPIDGKQWSTLTESGVQHIYVRSGEFQSFGKNLLQTVQSAVEIESVPPAERFAALQIALAVEIERTAHMIDCGPYVELAEKVAHDLINLLLNNDVLAPRLVPPRATRLQHVHARHQRHELRGDPGRANGRLR